MKAKIISLFLLLASKLPLVVARSLGAGIGSLCWRLNIRETKVTRLNLGQSFPEKDARELEALTCESMREWGKSLFEIPCVWGHSQQWLQGKVVSQQGAEIWDKYRKEDAGLIILGPHLGNWEVTGLTCSARAGKMTIMFAPSGYDAVDNLIRDARSRFGGVLVPTDKRGVLALIKSLRAGEVVGVLPDQEPPKTGGVYAPFFGVPALTMTLIHNLIKRSGAKALFVYARRVHNGFEVVYQEPSEAIYSEDQQTSVNALNEGVRECVLGAVAQYQWEYKRFKTRPNGEPNIYAQEKRK